ncbi:MAG: tRNA (cytosine(32)/uridine(32)-2'-O)-methyltransferase TrmJ [Armatimonadetes bacterium]|nr:tRNA (cytosine(32)/uridine(32)-2'-O)-methyltransferase TrmJ [Armatimonadota bacterium]
METPVESHRAVEYPAPEAMARIRIILVEPQYPGNIGASARAMKTAGIRDLVLVRPQPFRGSEEARNFASGARDVLEGARVVERLDDAIGGLHWLVGTTNRRRGGVLDQPIPVREAAQRIASLAQTRRVGILFGREDFGLSSADLARCNLAAAIPVAAGMPPLNLSHAVQVVSHEVFVAALGEPPPPPLKPAALPEVEALLRRFAELFALLGADALSRSPQQVLDSLRRAFSRVGLEPRDVRTLHMVVRAVTRRLKSERGA